jgi:hypothetical protein
MNQEERRGDKRRRGEERRGNSFLSGVWQTLTE